MAKPRALSVGVTEGVKFISFISEKIYSTKIILLLC